MPIKLYEDRDCTKIFDAPLAHFLPHDAIPEQFIYVGNDSDRHEVVHILMPANSLFKLMRLK